MEAGTVTWYRGCEVRPVMTVTAKGRDAAAVILAGQDGETRTPGIGRDFANSQDAGDEALETRRGIDTAALSCFGAVRSADQDPPGDSGRGAKQNDEFVAGSRPVVLGGG
jgi:hypothetical protein